MFGFDVHANLWDCQQREPDGRTCCLIVIPEHADRQECAADDHGNHALLRNYMALLLHLPGKSGLGEEDDEKCTKNYSDDDGQEWKCSDTRIPAALFLESDRICFEAKVKEAYRESANRAQYALVCFRAYHK